MKNETASTTAFLEFILEIEDGWPPVAVECLPFLLAPGGYTAVTAPLFVKDLSVGDIIRARLEPTGNRVVSWEHISRSQHSTLWLLRVGPSLTLAPVLDDLRRLGCSTESSDALGVYAVDIPASVQLNSVDDVLARLESNAVAVAFPSLRHEACESC
ncbi:MAG: DUF4265 domain-containing protein [Deltaproteobacteria bacterium]|nr:DUF4265 domain-containing protein [Deltaproteobacteria bacterium]MBK8717006.1 DUF4265 domain-containing protein [Deltaproteobacteria bacterium]